MANPDFESSVGNRPETGPRASLDCLARRYGHALARFFERRTDRSADVQDLVQEVFLRLARRGDLTTIEKPENYLFAAAASTLKDRARRNHGRRAIAHDQFDEASHGGSDFSAHRVLEGRLALARLYDALRGAARDNKAAGAAAAHRRFDGHARANRERSRPAPSLPPQFAPRLRQR